MWRIAAHNDDDRCVFTSSAMSFRECIQDAIAKQADLRGADLAHQDLRNLDFSNMNLHSANLSYSRADNALFCAADLRSAIMSHMHATGAVFNQANMSRVQAPHGHFCSAHFYTTDCTYASFMASDFTFAKLVGTVFYRANLHNALLGQAFVSHLFFTREQVQHYADNLATLFAENAETALAIRDYIALHRRDAAWDGRLSGLYDTLVRMGISNEALTALVEDCPSRFAFAANWFQRFRGDNLDDAYRQQEIERTLLWVNDWLHGRGGTPTAVPTTRPAQRRLALTRKEE